MDSMTFLAILLIGAWVLMGYLMFVWGTRTPRPGAIVRTASHRITLVGERIQVDLACSAAGAPVPPAPVEAWDIVLLIDHSGSMGDGPGSALDEARKAAINLVATTPASFRFAVVEFDHDSRCLCPLSDRKQGLTRAVRWIASGGNTDISLGLGACLPCLGTDADTGGGSERKRAVILLSDGGSDPAPALAQAERLKAQGVLLVTVGLGAADMSLLRALASDPDRCYRADRLEELAGIYTRIGGEMAQGSLRDVKVEEALDLRAFGVRAWGEVEPVERRWADGRFAWLLSTLGQEPTRLSYTVEAQCPGWHRIGASKARLTGTAVSSGDYTAESGRNPYVLVLPRIPGWQVLWLFLNPLFFKFFGRCPQPQFGPEVAPVLPQPRTFRLPEPLVGLPPAPTQLSVQPSLVIGLGYAGSHAIAHCKRLMWERDREDLSAQVRFLAIDTAGTQYRPPPAVGPVGLDPEECLCLTGPFEGIIREDANATSPRYPWLPARALLAGGARPDLRRGTGHQRSLGRLALLERRASVAETLEPIIAELAGCGPKLQVLIVGTTGGGTASGVFADLSWLLRRQLSKVGSDEAGISWFLMAPFATAVSVPREAELRRCNHEALMLEIDRLSVMRSQPLAPVAGETAERRWFDRLFLVGPPQAQTLDPDRDLYPRTGETLFCWLAYESFRSYFTSLDREVYALERQYGVAVGHRLEPASRYLYPRSVRLWLSLETLLDSLHRRLWNLDSTAPRGPYHLSEAAGGRGEGLRSALLSSANGTGALPWILANLPALQDEESLYKLLNAGGGPMISKRVGPLVVGEFMQRQRELTAARLDAWVSDALNGQLDHDTACGFGALYHAFGEIDSLLQRAASVANSLERQSSTQLVTDEVAVIGDLLTQGRGELKQWLEHLSQWGVLLGEGKKALAIDEPALKPFPGVMRRMRERAGNLREGLEATRRYASPTLALSVEPLKAIQQRYFQPEGDTIFERLMWRVSRNASQPVLELRVQGEALHSFRLDASKPAEVVDGLCEVLLSLMRHVAKEWEQVRLADIGQVGAMPIPTRPRLDNLSPGASGVYLYQGGNTGHSGLGNVEVFPVPAMDAKEERLVSVEKLLFAREAWGGNSCQGVLPFVQLQEFHAYQSHDLYRRAREEARQTLDPRLVSLFTDPGTLCDFALCGLMSGAIHSIERAGSVHWIDNNPSSGDGYLAEATVDPEETFLRVARAWMESHSGQTSSGGLGAEGVARLILGHSLLANVDRRWRKQFVELIQGLISAYQDKSPPPMGLVDPHRT